MADLLLEVISEPMPPGLQIWVWENMWKGLRDKVSEKSGYDIGEARKGERGLVTPYRVVLRVGDVPEETPMREVEKRGPREDAPSKALDGFFGSVGGSEHCKVEETPKGRFWFYRKQEGGGDMGEVLGEAIVEAVVGLKWPKVMRFGDEEALWVRPLQRLVAVWNGKCLGGGMDCAKRKWSAEGEGESWFPYQSTTWEDMLCVGLSDEPKEVEVGEVGDYEKLGVMLHEEERAEAIMKGYGGEDVERWARTCARLGERFFVVACEVKGEGGSLPKEVVRTALFDHMKVLVTTQGEGKISFLAAVEKRVEGTQDEALIREGYCKVAKARLRDAEFFWEEDKKKRLEDRLEDLGSIIWHAKAGSIGDKARRLEELAKVIVEEMGGDESLMTLVKRAGLLSKCDLASQLVGEYPSLQGVIGGYYAKHDGEDERVCEALSVQYKGAEDVKDVDLVAKVLYLADRVDTLTQMWEAGEQPTGSRDPFALRRAASQMLKCLWNGEIELPFSIFKNSAGVIDVRLEKYMLSRMEEVLSEKYESVFVRAAINCGEAWELHMSDVAVRCDVLMRLDEEGKLEDIADMWNRVSGLLGSEEVRGAYEAGDGEDEEEKVLWEGVLGLGGGSEDIEGYGKRLLMLQERLDNFCDRVRIHDSEKKENRMRLLRDVRSIIRVLCDGDPLVRMYSQRKSER